MKRLTYCILLLLTLSACRQGETDGKMIFRYNESAGINTLDPAFAKDQAHIWVCSQLYNSLVQLDTNLEVQPALAKRWTISPDGKTYTFILRDDVWFHKNALLGPDSTRRVTAEDMRYSLHRIIDPSVASPGRWIFSEVADDGFRVVDDTTFQVILKEPFAPFLSLLSMPYCSAVPREVVEHYGDDFRKHACGTGPFQLQWWEESEKLVMRKNPRYYEFDTLNETITRLPYLDAVAVTFIIDKQTAFLEFIKGNMDFMNSIDAGYKDEILTRTGQLKTKYADRIDMVSTPYLNTEYLGFRLDGNSQMLRDRRIRQAINMGFDRRKMMKYLRNGVGTPGTHGIVPVGLPGGGNKGYDYDVPRALQLLEEAGYPHGKGLPTLVLSTTSSYLDLCKYIQQQLGLMGVKVEIDVHPPAALREAIAQGKTDWFRGSWVADYPDAQNYLSLFYSGNFTPNGPNYTHFSNARYDALYRRALKESDVETRQRLYQQMDSIAAVEAPIIVLYYDQILHFTHKNINGLRSNAMNALDLRRVRKTL